MGAEGHDDHVRCRRGLVCAEDKCVDDSRADCRQFIWWIEHVAPIGARVVGGGAPSGINDARPAAWMATTTTTQRMAWALSAVDGIEPEVALWGVGATVKRTTRICDSVGSVTSTVDGSWPSKNIAPLFRLVATVTLDNGGTIEVIVSISSEIEWKDDPYGMAYVSVDRGVHATVAEPRARDRAGDITSVKGPVIHRRAQDDDLDRTTILCLRVGLAMVHMRCIRFNDEGRRGTFATGRYRLFGAHEADIVFGGGVDVFCTANEVERRGEEIDWYQPFYYDPRVECATASAFLEWARKATTIVYAVDGVSSAQKTNASTILERIVDNLFGGS